MSNFWSLTVIAVRLSRFSAISTISESEVWQMGSLLGYWGCAGAGRYQGIWNKGSRQEHRKQRRTICIYRYLDTRYLVAKVTCSFGFRFTFKGKFSWCKKMDLFLPLKQKGISLRLVRLGILSTSFAIFLIWMELFHHGTKWSQHCRSDSPDCPKCKKERHLVMNSNRS